MRSFLKNVLYFVVGFLCLNLTVYFLLFKPAIFENYIYNQKKLEDYNQFLLSDSHGAFLKNIPNKFGIFNFSNTGENYQDMYLKLLFLSQRLSSNDTIFVSIDNHQLSTYRDNSNNIDRNILYCKNYRDLGFQYPKTKFYFKKAIKYFPLCNVDFNKEMVSYIYYRWKSNRKITASPIERAVLDTIKLKYASQGRYRHQFKNKRKSLEQTEFLNKLIIMCKENRIPLVGIKFPITKLYWDMIKNDNYGGDSILIENNIPIIDLYNLFFDENQFFSDQDHLNTQGALLFCQKLEEERRKLK